MAQGSAEPPTVSGPAGTEGRAAIYSVELDLFEGPLDLLLHLVRRHELDILDIPIAFVAEKYLEYLHLMRSLDLEIAGDYLVMAATLAWLKSRELLPQGPREGEQAGADDEEGEDPREALIRRLVEYERFKSAAAELDALPISGRDVFARGADIDIPPLDPGLAPVTLFRLAEAYYRVLTRAKINKTHDVTIELVTVAQRMQQLTLMLDERQEFDFEGLFLSRTWSSEHELRTMLVVTLMSVLELVKLGVARVQQVPDTTAIRVYRLAAADEARKLLEAYDEEASFGAPAEPAPDEPRQPTEAELDAIEERTLLAEALAGLDGTEDPDAPLEEIGVLAEVLDPEALDDQDVAFADEADLGPDAIAATAANTAGTPDLADSSDPELDAADHELAEGEPTDTPADSSDPGLPDDEDATDEPAPQDMSDADGDEVERTTDVEAIDEPDPDADEDSGVIESTAGPTLAAQPDPDDPSAAESEEFEPTEATDPPDPEAMSEEESDASESTDAAPSIAELDPQDMSDQDSDQVEFADVPVPAAEPDPEDMSDEDGEASESTEGPTPVAEPGLADMAAVDGDEGERNVGAEATDAPGPEADEDVEAIEASDASDPEDMSETPDDGSGAAGSRLQPTDEEPHDDE